MSRLSRDRIAAEAIALADEDGVDAVSMRRVAQRLDVGTMSLYHHVPNKDALYAAMGNAIMAEFIIPPDEMPSGWRAGLREIALRTKASYDRHPWMMLGMLQGQEPQPSENLMRHADQTLGTMSGLPLTGEERLHLSGLVDEYVIGHAFRELSDQAEEETTDFRAQRMEWFREMLLSEGMPNFRELFETDNPTPEDAWALYERTQAYETFERGLDVVLDGIAAYIERRHR